MAIGTGTAILGTSLLGLGGAVGSSLLGSSAEQDANDEALRFLQEQIAQGRADLEPFRTAGTNALGRFVGTTQGDFSGFTETPGFQFRLGQGINALDRSAASRGQLLSGRQLKGVQRFGEGLAAQEFHNFQNRLAQLSNLGLAASQSSANLSSGLGGAGANLLVNSGQSQAQNFANIGNAISGTSENALNAFLLSSLLGQGSIT